MATVPALGNVDNGWCNRQKSDPNAAEPSLTNFSTVFNLRTRLQGINAAYFTNQMLDIMSVNDMIYALRLNDLPNTI